MPKCEGIGSSRKKDDCFPTTPGTGLCAESRHSLDFALSAPKLGQAVATVPGGTKEALYTAPRQYCLKFLIHKGFVRLALRHR